MNMHWCSLKTDCTIKFSIPKLYENTPFDNFNVTHVGTKNHQVTITFIEIQENALINTEKMKVDEHALCSLKTDCTIELHIPKLYENTPFHNLNVTDAGTKKHQVTRTEMEDQGNILINTKKMKVHEHALVLIKNRLHH